MLRVVLERLLFGPSGLATAGLPLPIAGQHRLVYGRLANLLSDGDGHRQELDWRGATSLKPCFKHVNIFKKDRIRTHRVAQAGQELEMICLASVPCVCRLRSVRAAISHT